MILPTQVTVAVIAYAILIMALWYAFMGMPI